MSLLPWREIATVTANTITCEPAFTATLPGQSYTIVDGAGIRIAESGNGGCVKGENVTIQNVNGAAYDNLALYGGVNSGMVYETNLSGEHIGRRNFNGTGERSVQNHSSRSSYFEVMPGGYYVIGSTNFGCLIENPVIDGVADNGRDAIRFVDPTTARKVRITMGGMSYERKCILAYTSISGDGANISLNLNDIVFAHVHAAAVTGITIDLPAAPAVGSRSEAMLNQYTPTFTILITDDLGGPVTVKCSAGSLVNGVAGATGLKYSGSYQVIQGYWRSDRGYVLGGGRMQGSAVIDLPNLAPGAYTFFNIAVPGAAVGDICEPISPSTNLEAGLALLAPTVSAAGNVTCYAVNTNAAGGANIDSASRTYTARVYKK